MNFSIEIDFAMSKDKIGIINKDSLDNVFSMRRSSFMSLPSIHRQVLLVVKKTKSWLAGGAALALYSGETSDIKDWDVFLTSYQHLLSVREELFKIDFVETSRTDWSVNLEKSGVIVQLVTKNYYNTIKQIFEKFDFTICCFAIDGEYVYFSNQAKEDLDKREFNFIYTENILSCIKRIARYGAKGFVPSNQFVQDISPLFKNVSKKQISLQSKMGKS